MKSLNALQPLALLLLRVSFGVIFLWHAYPLLTRGNAATYGEFAALGLPKYFVVIEGVVELFGGGLLLLGLFARGAALLLALEHALLIWKIYTPRSYFAVNEYAYLMLVVTACFVLVTMGAGPISVDYPLFESRSGKARAPRNGKAGK